MTFKDTKLKVENILKRGIYTVDQICKELGFSDDFDIITSIACLEYEGKSKSVGYNQAHNSDGTPVLMSRYTHV